MRILKQHLQALASPRRIRIEQLQGPLRRSGAEITVVYAGNGSNAEYLSGLIFDRIDSRKLLAEVSPLFLEKTLRRFATSGELIVSERAPLWDSLSTRPGTLRMPAWIRQELRLAENSQTTATAWKLGRHLDREVQRHIRRHHYHVTMSDDPVDKDVFFRDLYVPYIRARHALDAVTVGEDLFKATASGAVLAKLHTGDVWTAGMLLHYRADELKFGWFGSRTNPPLPGASEVLDWTCIAAAADRGSARINFGNARPSLADGVLKYKRKFGVESLAPRYPQTMIEWLLRSDRGDLREWFNNQQFLCMHDGILAVARYSAANPAGVSYHRDHSPQFPVHGD